MLDGAAAVLPHRCARVDRVDRRLPAHAVSKRRERNAYAEHLGGHRADSSMPGYIRQRWSVGRRVAVWAELPNNTESAYWVWWKPDLYRYAPAGSNTIVTHKTRLSK